MRQRAQSNLRSYGAKGTHQNLGAGRQNLPSKKMESKKIAPVTPSPSLEGCQYLLAAA